MDDSVKLTVLKRKAILEAARQEFFARGYEGTSMDRIASVATVSKRTVYNHFATKEVLFNEVTDAQLDEVQKICGEFVYDGTTSLEDQLCWFAHCQIQYFGSDGYLRVARLILMERLRSPNRDADLEELFEQTGSGLEQWLEAAAADGKLSIDNAKPAARQFFSLIKAFALWPQLFGYRSMISAEEAAQVAENTVQLFLNGYSDPANPQTNSTPSRKESALFNSPDVA